MKTTNQINEASAPANGRSSSVSKTSNTTEKQKAFILHNANRALTTQKVLTELQTRFPRFYELAEIVGKWVWLDIPAASQRTAAAALWRLGFHWNERRGVWQHPCGACAPFAIHTGDPRAKYGSRFAADQHAI